MTIAGKIALTATALLAFGSAVALYSSEVNFDIDMRYNGWRDKLCRARIARWVSITMLTLSFVGFIAAAWVAS